jgi:hypothetical protein
VTGGFLKRRESTYDFSRISRLGKNSSDYRSHHDGSGNFIGRSFRLLFGSGILEYDRNTKDFDFSFGYNTGMANSIEDVILTRLRVASYADSGVAYKVRVYPADLDSVYAAYKKIEVVNGKLKLAKKISKTIDDMLR